MDNYVQELINQIHDVCHRIEGYLDAKAALKPNLRFVEDDDEPKVLIFPSNRNSAFKEDQIKKPDADTPGTEQEFVIFSEQEMKQMPKTIKRLILLEGKRCRLRTRRSGENSTTYQIRFRRDGYDVNACGKTIELAKANFLKKLRTAQPKKEQMEYHVPETFSAFAMYHFETFQKEKVSKEHYENCLRLFNRYLAPHFKETSLKDINPSYCKAILDEVKAQGKGKTANDLHSILNGIFKNAIAHAFIERNPLALILHVQHKSENGVALSKAEESALFNTLHDADFATAAALVLFCGLRPNELATAQIEGDFIKAINSKRKGGKIEYKYIPIINRLRPYLPCDGAFHIPNLDMLRRAIKNALPGHKLYDLRTTFYTRCDEYGVAPPARDEFVGHSSGVLTNTYRDLSKEYLLSEGKKLDKWV